MSIPKSIDFESQWDQTVSMRPKRHAFPDINEDTQGFRCGGATHEAIPAYCQGERGGASRPTGPIRLIWSVSPFWEQAPVKLERLPICQIDQTISVRPNRHTLRISFYRGVRQGSERSWSDYKIYLQILHRYVS